MKKNEIKRIVLIVFSVILTLANSSILFSEPPWESQCYAWVKCGAQPADDCTATATQSQPSCFAMCDCYQYWNPELEDWIETCDWEIICDGDNYYSNMGDCPDGWICYYSTGQGPL